MILADWLGEVGREELGHAECADAFATENLENQIHVLGHLDKWIWLETIKIIDPLWSLLI